MLTAYTLMCKPDVGLWGMFLCCALSILILFGIVNTFIWIFFGYNKTLDLIYSSIGARLSCGSRLLLLTPLAFLFTPSAHTSPWQARSSSAATSSSTRT